MDLALLSDADLFDELERRFENGYVFIGGRDGDDKVGCDHLIYHMSSNKIYAAGLVRAAQLYYDRKLSIELTDEEYEQYDDI